MDTRAIGMAVVGLGGGRMRAADAIDFAVGLGNFVELGAKVKAGQPLGLVHARSADASRFAVQAIQQAITIGDIAPSLPPSIYEAVRS
jgi:thymidine phosphorylase